MKKTVHIDENNVELSVHQTVSNSYVITLTDREGREPYNWQFYKLDLEDIDSIIKDLKAIKKLMLQDE